MSRFRIHANECKKNADDIHKVSEYIEKAEDITEAFFRRAYDVSMQGEYKFGFEIGYNEPNRAEIIKYAKTALEEHGYTVTEEPDHKTFYVHW